MSDPVVVERIVLLGSHIAVFALGLWVASYLIERRKP